MPWLPTYMSHGWGKGVRKGRDNEDLRTIDSDETRLDQSAIANKRLSTPARHAWNFRPERLVGSLLRFAFPPRCALTLQPVCVTPTQFADRSLGDSI